MNGPEQDHIPKTLAVKLPLDFKKLGLATHRAFDKIAAEAEQRGNADSVPKQLGELMKNCVACHGTWRIVAEDSR
jgi:cytochrome c556